MYIVHIHPPITLSYSLPFGLLRSYFMLFFSFYGSLSLIKIVCMNMHVGLFTEEKLMTALSCLTLWRTGTIGVSHHIQLLFETGLLEPRSTLNSSVAEDDLQLLILVCPSVWCSRSVLPHPAEPFS